MCVWLKARLLKSISCYFGVKDEEEFKDQRQVLSEAKPFFEKRRNRSTENIKQASDGRYGCKFLEQNMSILNCVSSFYVAQQHHCDPGTVKSLLIAPENSSMLTFSRSQKLSNLWICRATNSKMDFQRRYFCQCRRCFQSYPQVGKSQQKRKHVTEEFAESNTTTDLCVPWLFVDGCRDQRSCQG